MAGDDDAANLLTTPTWLQRSSGLKQPPCCIERPYTKHLKCDNISHPVPKWRRQVTKCDMNIDIANKDAAKSILQQLHPGSYFPAKRRSPFSASVIFILSLLCVLTAHVSSGPVRFPYGCMYSNSSEKEPGLVTSIHCSGLGLGNYTIEHSDDVENKVYVNSTGVSNQTNGGLSKVHLLYLLDLSHNKLTSVSPVVQADGVEASAEDATFKIQVEILNLSFNNITQVQAGQLGSFTGTASLDLSHNQIQWLDEDAFVGHGDITRLNLSYNEIEDFTNSTFLGLDNLITLDLSHNGLLILPVNNMSVLSSLQYLYINNNNIHRITMSTLNVLPSLIHLDISNTQLKQIPSKTFNNFQSLKTLILANSSIQEVSNDFLKGLHSLEVLILDQNNIPAISTPLFRNTSLTRLSLASMPLLCNLSHDVFLGLSSLVSLNLSNNPQVTFLQPNLFTPLANLQVLDVSDSGLSELSQITFTKNDNLNEIRLTNNPFLCSCTNAWLAKEASNNLTRFVNASSLYCISHSNVRTSINNASFDCDGISMHNATSDLSVKLGSQLLFQCQLMTNNPAVVVWRTPAGYVFYHHHFHPDASQHLLSPRDVQPGAKFHKGHYWHHTSSYHSELSSSDQRVMILTDGSLYIDYMLQADAGTYQCQVTNAAYNETMRFTLLVDCQLAGHVHMFALIVGLICAVAFFTLNLIYVIISWIARRLVNKRRREIIRAMLENMNVYKTAQVARIHENYTHQINRVRNQYHTQCSRLHRNYTSQVKKVKRGCSNQVERVRDNYNSKLAGLRDYSSNQIMQIRERANNQIIRIRDYGASQFEKLRETYKFQQQHVLKLLDTMNLENCRNIVETECMRAESMMYDIDLLGDDDRTDSPTSPGDSEYNTAATSPSSSLEDDDDSAGLRMDMSHSNRELSTGSSENSGKIVQVQTTIDFEARLPPDSWNYDLGHFDHDDGHDYLMNIHRHDDPPSPSPLSSGTLFTISGNPHKPGIRLPTLELKKEHPRRQFSHGASSSGQVQDSRGLYMATEESPSKVFSAYDQNGKSHKAPSYDYNIDFCDSSSNETNV